jgi:hypothetical protein
MGYFENCKPIFGKMPRTPPTHGRTKKYNYVVKGALSDYTRKKST